MTNITAFTAFTVLDSYSIHEKWAEARKNNEKERQEVFDVSQGFDYILQLVDKAVNIAIGEQKRISSEEAVRIQVDLTTLVNHLLEQDDQTMKLIDPVTGTALHLSTIHLEDMSSASVEAFDSAYEDNPRLLDIMPNKFKIGLAVCTEENDGTTENGVMIVTGVATEHHNRFAVTFLNSQGDEFGGVTQVNFQTPQLDYSAQLLTKRGDLVGGLTPEELQAVLEYPTKSYEHTMLAYEDDEQSEGTTYPKTEVTPPPFPEVTPVEATDNTKSFECLEPLLSETSSDVSNEDEEPYTPTTRATRL